MCQISLFFATVLFLFGNVFVSIDILNYFSLFFFLFWPMFLIRVIFVKCFGKFFPTEVPQICEYMYMYTNIPRSENGHVVALFSRDGNVMDNSRTTAMENSENGMFLNVSVRKPVF